MKRLQSLKAISLITFYFLLASSVLQAQMKNNAKVSLNKWCKSHEWLNGLEQTPHSSSDKKEMEKQYHANKRLWNKAIAYIKYTDLKNIRPRTYHGHGYCTHS